MEQREEIEMDNMLPREQKIPADDCEQETQGEQPGGNELHQQSSSEIDR
jgi:hypothetical protein